MGSTTEPCVNNFRSSLNSNVVRCTIEYEDVDDCARCHGEGWIYESEGDQSDWQEDTYCGSDDSVIACRVCNGTGVIK